MASGELRETLPISGQGADGPSRSSVLPFTPSAADGGAGGVPCVSIGDVPTALDTVHWQMGPGRRLTVVLKADFRVDPIEGTSKPAAWPPRFNPADVRSGNQQGAHVSAASDRAPWKRNVDVTLLGLARAALGGPLPQVGLTFSGREGGRVLFERRAVAFGERATKDSAPEPFATMPVVYERSYGGSATPANPIGVGDAACAPVPNIIDASNPWRPAAFGPLASDWPLRLRKLGALRPSDLEAPLLVLPADFDVSYFQSAPADQQVPELGPTATFVLEGFHRERARVEIGLPRALPAGAVYGLSPALPDSASPLHFRLDTVHVEAQVWVLTLTYRACIELPDEATFARLRVAAGLGMNGKACPWPETWQGVTAGPVMERDVRQSGPRDVPTKAPRDVRQSGPRDVQQSGPGDVRQSGQRDVRQSGPRDVPRKAPRAPGLSETRELPPSSFAAPPSLPFGEHRSPFVGPPSPTAMPPEKPEMLPLPAAPPPEVPPTPAAPPPAAPPILAAPAPSPTPENRPQRAPLEAPDGMRPPEPPKAPRRPLTRPPPRVHVMNKLYGGGGKNG